MLLDGYISSGRLQEFIHEFEKIVNEEIYYDYWKCRVFDMSFADYMDNIKPKPKKEVDVAKIIDESFETLKNFNPMTGGGI